MIRGASLFVHANKIDIYYEEYGEGRPFLLLHGNGEDHTLFADLAASLSSTYHVYALDTRCHGKSTKTATIGYMDMMEDVAAFITALELKKPLLLGFSDGGITGLLLAIHYPELLSGMIACGANTNPQQLKKPFLLFARLAYFFSRDAKYRMMYTQPDIRSCDLSTIQTPVLLLAGTRDVLPVSTTMQIAASIPGSQCTILEKQTHISYIRHSERVLQAIQPFLKE